MTDPRSPHLAIPSLAAYLRARGVSVGVRDLDLECFLHAIEPDRVEDAIGRCEKRLREGGSNGDGDRLREALATSDRILDTIQSAPSMLRDPASFFDPHRHRMARGSIIRALELVSAATGRIDYNVGGARYDVDGYSATRLADLAKVTADPGANLFDDVYRERVAVELDRDRPDVVGISILNRQQIIPGLTLARLLKDRGHFVVIGGTVYSKFVPQLLARPEFFRLFCDALVPYEGETALLGILEERDGRGRLDRVPNVMSLDPSGEVRMGSPHVEDVSALPTPDFEGLPLDRYLAPAPVLPILFGKGCYFNRCKFCEIPFINRISPKPYRVRGAEQVAEDLATLHRRHGGRHFEFTDETLAPALLLRLADELEAHPDIDPRFVGYARFERSFTQATCERLYGMGMRKLFFGLESGSQATIDHMDKGFTVQTARDVLRSCNEAGIAFHVFSIVGFPEETEDRARETLRFFLDNRSVIDRPENSFDIHPFGLDLRAEYFEEADRFGIEVDRVAMDAEDFPISAERWKNTRGINEATAARLLEEFGRELRAAFPSYRRYPDQLWPTFEEYAVLYGEHFEERSFGYRYTLPPDGDPTPIGLVLSEQASVEQVDGRYVCSSVDGAVTVDAPGYLVVTRERPAMPVDELLDQMVAAAPEAGNEPALRRRIRLLVDALLANGILWLRPAPDALAVRPAPHRAVPGA